ncbi:histidine phosphatase family protein [Motiliproteus sp. MSK22-1]|uniref:histidine phosphatase family protein n=1 Tax=Motiliproteus sp. MSK22-1 TaxID=1897630 RepID=UPI000977E215|nr:histidine phosphatase family protein [Motiliproteus sp. MSK22-1]OMH30447.1 hypothetical protein BGP75_18370 [Motiliproteus sp. MSK22-1]
MIPTRIDMLRHGICEDGDIYRGRTDSPLSPEGRTQMLKAVEGGSWDLIYSSPLQRCQGFAQELSERLQRPLVVDERLIELDFGEWDGQGTAEVWQQQQSAVLAFWQDPEVNTPPGAEPLRTMRDRVVRLLYDLHRQLDGQRILWVSHGGVIRILLSYLLQMPLQAMRQISVAYGSLSRIELYQQQSEGPLVSEVVFTNRLSEIVNYDRS